MKKTRSVSERRMFSTIVQRDVASAVLKGTQFNKRFGIRAQPHVDVQAEPRAKLVHSFCPLVALDDTFFNFAFLATQTA